MLKDPHLGGPTPPFRVPGAGADLDPKPDHGEYTYLGSSRLQNYAAIVLGGDSGIGRAVAIAFAREGANVLLAYQADRNGAEETARWVSEAGRPVALCPGDPNSEDYHHLLIEQALRQFGSLDVLVSDAPPTGSVGPDKIEEAIRSGQESIFALSLLAAEKMRPGAAIVTTTLPRSEHSPALQRAYAAYRGSIVNLTASLALKLAARGVRVNAVEPGPVWAPRMLAMLTEEQLASFGASTVFGRPAQPAELAPAYVLLASAQASFITGTVLPVTGGQLDPTSATTPRFGE
jgi:NAD(P)-dependent dehydrogenase (short-subunit alcohol dehydrogenase family)